MRQIGRPRGQSLLAGVLLHGRYITPEGKVDLAARLGHLDGIRWIVPASDGGSWYPNRFMDSLASNEPFLSQAVEECHSAVEEASEGGNLPPSRIVIGGFSQGACIALEYVLRHPGRCGTLIVFTGALMDSANRVWDTSRRPLAGLRALITGSDVDDWVPERFVREAAHLLVDLGADVRLRIYQGRPHAVCEDEVSEARGLIESCLP
jgi:predicted esterase